MSAKFSEEGINAIQIIQEELLVPIHEQNGILVLE
jgi:hypothetical protein